MGFFVVVLVFVVVVLFIFGWLVLGGVFCGVFCGVLGQGEFGCLFWGFLGFVLFGFCFVVCLLVGFLFGFGFCLRPQE